MHDTAFSAVPFAPVGVGVCWIDQPTPFQRSTSADDDEAVGLVGVKPTAVQAVSDGHETPRSIPRPGTD